MTVLSHIFVLLIILCSLSAQGQELTPRTYWPAPVGTRVATIGMSYVSGDTVPDPSLPLTGVDSEITTAYMAYRHTLGWWGRTTNLIVELPYSDGSTEVSHPELGSIERDYQGVGDVAMTLSVNLKGAPAMDREGFAQLRAAPRPLLGASLKVVAPTGDYNSNRVVNVGSNRWAMKAELGYMTVLNPKWLLEFELGSWFFDDNDDFLGLTRKQDPIVAAQLHLVRRFSPGFWASLDLNGYKGGRSEVNGRKLDDLQRDSKIGTTLVFPFAKGHAFKVSYSTGSANDADEDFDTYLVSYQRIF